jgi:hypothetical protein
MQRSTQTNKTARGSELRSALRRDLAGRAVVLEKGYLSSVAYKAIRLKVSGTGHLAQDLGGPLSENSVVFSAY